MCWLIIIIENEFKCNINFKKLIVLMHNSLRVKITIHLGSPQLQHVGSSSLTRDGTWAPCIGCAAS